MYFSSYKEASPRELQRLFKDTFISPLQAEDWGVLEGKLFLICSLVEVEPVDFDNTRALAESEESILMYISRSMISLPSIQDRGTSIEVDQLKDSVVFLSFAQGRVGFERLAFSNWEQYREIVTQKLIGWIYTKRPAIFGVPIVIDSAKALIDRVFEQETRADVIPKSLRGNRGETGPFAERLLNGEHEGPFHWSNVEDSWQQSEYDLVVDEKAGLVIVNGPEQLRIDGTKIGRGQRVLLWVFLQGVGRYLTYSDIEEIRDKRSRSQTKSMKQIIHQDRTRLSKSLGGDLMARILVPGISGGYEIQRHGWSFLWIREHEEEVESELLKERWNPRRYR